MTPQSETQEMGTKNSAAIRVEHDPRWARVRARDKSADGEFFYSVKTTGIYCRPSCAARPARAENVAFHRSAAAAERAGFRPCKRCKPDQAPIAERQAAQIAELCRLLEQSEAPPTLDVLARHVGLSSFHLHRLFKRVTGLTPRAYAAAARAVRVRRALRTESSVTRAIYQAGYGSGSRFYEKSAELLGMSPRRFRDGGSELDIQFAVGACSLGAVLVAATSRGVCAILLDDDPARLVLDPERRFPNAQLRKADATFMGLVTSVVELVDHPERGQTLPLDIRGTAFQARVWRALAEIPPGTTATYAQIAKRLGAPQAARAVAGACAANPLAVAVPCHRVVRGDGTPSGYRWGLARKQALLEREAAPPQQRRRKSASRTT